jgi:hypothetical protein
VDETPYALVCGRNGSSFTLSSGNFLCPCLLAVARYRPGRPCRCRPTPPFLKPMQHWSRPCHCPPVPPRPEPCSVGAASLPEPSGRCLAPPVPPRPHATPPQLPGIVPRAAPGCPYREGGRERDEEKERKKGYLKR